MEYEFGPVTVPAHHLLVLGDNRNASLDSHLWGPLPEDEVIGTAFWRYWPLQRFGPIRFSHPGDGLGAAEELR
jgi:signal peptidase I